jgi:hypothetical protein
MVITPPSPPAGCPSSNRRPGFRPRLEALERRDLLSTLTVLNAQDSGPGSLRDTLAQASDGDVVVFDQSLAGQTIHLTSGSLTVSQSVTIQGPGADSLAISADNASREFTIAAGVDALISGLTLENGNAPDRGGAVLNDGTLTLQGCVLLNNSAGSNSGPSYGGAVANDGDLAVCDSTFTGNTAGEGGALDNMGGLLVTASSFTNNSVVDPVLITTRIGGGAVANHGTLTVMDSDFTGNTVVGFFSVTGRGGAVANDGSATLSGCTLSDNTASRDGGAVSNTGTFTITGGVFSGNSADSEGGAVWNGVGMLTATGCTFADNTATSSGVIGGGNGGAVANEFQGTLVLASCTLYENVAGGSGGGVFNSSTLTVDGCTFARNSSNMPVFVPVTGGGGGICNVGTLTVARSTFANNLAAGPYGNNSGGGILNLGMLDLADSFFSGNVALDTGGGLANYPSIFGGSMNVTGCTFANNTGANGGAVANDAGGTVQLTNCTLFLNTAIVAGGGVYDLGALALQSCTVYGNRARFGPGGGIDVEGTSAAVTLDNTIVAQNGAATTGYDVSGVVVSQGYNLIGITDGSSGWFETDLTGTQANPLNPGLDFFLEDHGGPTPTVALEPGSPALRHGDPALLGTTDQRGMPRVGFVDIGAYQLTV